MTEKIKENQGRILLTLKEEHRISNIFYSTRLEPLKPHSLRDNTMTIIVPEQTLLQYVNKKYGFSLKVTISGFLEKECGVDFRAKGQAVETEELSASRLIRNDEVSVSPDVIQSANLNSKCIFDTFTAGGNNSLTHTATLTAAEFLGGIYNPLFIYGGVELDKAHLMYIIAHFILKSSTKSKILYVTSETFTNELIGAIHNKNNIATTEFGEKYGGSNIFLIDDIQFIIGKESTQEEFFRTSSTLYESKRQIIIFSDKPSEEIETLEERLRSYFGWGLTVDIQSPGYGTEMAILHKKEEMGGYSIDDEVIKCIITNTGSNICELEGAPAKIVALSRLNKCDTTLELAKKALKDIISSNAQKEVTPDLTIQVVSDHFGPIPLDISSQKHGKGIVYPRQIVMYPRRDITTTPLQTIKRCLGGRGHATIIHGAGKMTGDTAEDDTLRNTIGVLEKKINP